nr:MAG: hypothetical protein DIU70_00965 [Bacillota bacterium]
MKFMCDNPIPIHLDNPAAMRFMRTFAAARTEVASYRNSNITAVVVFDGATYYMLATAPGKGVSYGLATDDEEDVDRWMKPIHLYRLLGV